MRRLLEQLRMRFTSPDFGGRRIGGPCFVLGSAPSALWPDERFAAWTLLTVNAAQAVAPAPGSEPDITLMSGQMLGNEPVNREAKRVLRGRSTGELWLIERGISAAAAAALLREMDFTYRALRLITPRQRSRITHRQLGIDASAGSGEQKISTGTFAALLALEQGATAIVLSGFSLSDAGHAYNRLGHKRYHVDSDRAALQVAVERRLPIYTVCPDFSQASGVPLWNR
jgi:hypothetical protein